MMQMAVKAQMHRTLAGGLSIKRRRPMAEALSEDKRLGETHLTGAMKQHARAIWTKPPTQRLGSSLIKFVV